MDTEERKPYPIHPPDDFLLKLSTTPVELRMNPKGIEQKAKFCPICDFPANVRIVIQPCMHYFCYQCYCADTFQCRLCNTIIKEHKRLDDNASFYNCDQENCFKYFETLEGYDAHLKQHQAAETQIVN